MWSRYLSNAARQSARFSRRTNSFLTSRMAQARQQSTGANASAWTKGMLFGAGALGVTCAYLTTKAFALNKDSVRQRRVHERIEQSSVEDDGRKLCLQG